MKRAFCGTGRIYIEGVWPMSSLTFRSSRPDPWTLPRPHSDPSLRHYKHGPIQPMQAPPTFWERLLGLR